jgi:hypothetical protein
MKISADRVDLLGLDRDERCLDFRQADSPVKTASVWQVREDLHTPSSGRWRNDEPFMAEGERTCRKATSKLDLLGGDAARDRATQ